MLKILAEGFVSSVRNHPALTVFVVLVMGCMWFYNEQTYAKKVAVKEINDGLMCRLDKLDVRALEQSIADIESAVFELERVHDSGDATERDQQYLLKLRASRDSKLRELQGYSSVRGKDCE